MYLDCDKQKAWKIKSKDNLSLVLKGATGRRMLAER